MKPYTIYRTIPLSMTLSDLWPDFKVMTFLKSNIWKTTSVKADFTLMKLYLTYGMVYVWW